MRLHTIATVVSLLSVLITAAVRADVWSEAEKQIVRLDPSMFNELPTYIVDELKVRNCKVPQTYGFLEKASVVHYCNEGQWIELTGAD